MRLLKWINVSFQKDPVVVLGNRIRVFYLTNTLPLIIGNNKFSSTSLNAFPLINISTKKTEGIRRYSFDETILVCTDNISRTQVRS